MDAIFISFILKPPFLNGYSHAHSQDPKNGKAPHLSLRYGAVAADQTINDSPKIWEAISLIIDFLTNGIRFK
jgi:hypothetical protein